MNDNARIEWPNYPLIVVVCMFADLFVGVCKVSSIELQYDLRRTSDVEGFVNVWSNTSLMDKLVYGSRRYEKETTKTKEEEEEEERESDPNPRSSPASNVTSGDGTKESTGFVIFV